MVDTIMKIVVNTVTMVMNIMVSTVSDITVANMVVVLASMDFILGIMVLDTTVARIVSVVTVDMVAVTTNDPNFQQNQNTTRNQEARNTTLLFSDHPLFTTHLQKCTIVHH